MGTVLLKIQDAAGKRRCWRTTRRWRYAVG